MPTRLPQTRQLETFRAVMLAGGVSAGAALLGISQPAASRLLRDLEAALGLVLFQRRPGGRLMATQDARALFAPVEQHARSAEAVVAMAAALRASRSGRLRVAAGPTLAQQILPEVLAEVARRHPRVALSLVTGMASEVADLIAQDGADVGLAAAIGPTPGVETRILATGAARCAVPAQWSLARQGRVPIAALHRRPFVQIGGEGLFQLRIAAALREAGVQPQVRLVVPSSAAAALFVAQGMGAAILDPFAARQAAGRLAVRPLDLAIPYEAALLLPEAIPPRGPVRSFIEALAERGLASAG